MSKPDQCRTCKANGVRQRMPYGWSCGFYCDACWKKQGAYVAELRLRDAEIAELERARG